MKAACSEFALNTLVLALMGLLWVSKKLEPVLADHDPAIPGGV